MNTHWPWCSLPSTRTSISFAMSRFNDLNHFTDSVYFSVQMRSFLFLPFLQALDTASPPDLFKVHLVVFKLLVFYFIWQVYRFGLPEKLGTGQEGPDFLQWNGWEGGAGAMPKQVGQESVESTVWRSFQMTLCFNMRYTALDSWSDGQKTILRLFQVVTQNWKMEN